MAVAKVGSTGTKNDGTGTTHTLSYTLNGSANFLLARIQWNEVGDTISSVTWDGGAMTAAGSVAADGDDHKCVIYYLASPATGTRNLVVTFSGAVGGAFIGADGYSGVDTTTPVSDYTTGISVGSAASPASITIDSATDDLVVDLLGWAWNGATMTVGAGQTEDVNLADTLFGGSHAGCSSEPGATSVTMSWTYTGNLNWAMAGLNIKAASGGGGASSGPYRTTRNLRARAI